MTYEDAVKRRRCIEIIRQLRGPTLDEAKEILEELLDIENDVEED